MSQKDSKFQSKGRKPGGKGPSRFGGGKKPAGRGFGKRFEGDRKEGGATRSFGDKPRRSFDGDKKSFGDRKPRAFGEDRKPRAFGDRPPRRDNDDRPRRSYGEDSRGGSRSFGDRKPFKKRFDDRDGERKPRDFGDRPPRREFDGERKPFKKSFDSDRPRRSFDNDRDRKPFVKRERMDGTDRAFAAARPKSADDVPFERPKRPEKPFRSRDEGNRKTYQRPFDERKTRKPFLKREDRDHQYVPHSFEEATPETRQRLKSDRASFGAPSSAFIYGTHPVRAALMNPKRLLQRLLVTESGFENIREAYDEAVNAGIKVPQPTYVGREDIERLLPRDAVHQDTLLDSQPPEEVFLVDILLSAPANAKVVILDQVTDPHNVGAIMRSAVAFGAFAVVAQKLHAPEITGTLAKSASGAAEHIPLVREVNLSRAIEQLKEAGFTCLGLDERGKQTIAEYGATGKVAIVMGAEGDGLRRLVAENCDALVKLPTSGPIASLNVSNAAAVALYELVRNG